MRKNKKIVHYKKNSYFDSKKSMSPLKILVIIAVIIVLIFVGWSSYEPVMNFLEEFKNNISDKSQSSEVSDISSDISVSNEESETQSESSIEDEKENEISKTEEINNYGKSIYIPTKYLTDYNKSYEYFMEKQKITGKADSITIYVKDDIGYVHLPVENQIAIQNKAVIEESSQIAETIKKFKENNIKVNGIISTFKDSRAPINNDKCHLYRKSDIYHY